MRWDKTLDDEGRTRLRQILNGHAVVGYPPSVEEVDVRPEGTRGLLRESDVIGWARDPEGGLWTFAVPNARMADVVEMPCSRITLIDEYLLDLDMPYALTRFMHGLTGWQKSLWHPNGEAVYVYSTHQLARFDGGGHRWTREGLFGGNLLGVSATRTGNVICRGFLDWDHEERELEIDPADGSIAGGDLVLLKAHGGP